MEMKRLEDLGKGDLIRFIHKHQLGDPDAWNYCLVTGSQYVRLEQGQNPDELVEETVYSRDEVEAGWYDDCKVGFWILYDPTRDRATTHFISYNRIRQEDLVVERTKVMEVRHLVYGLEKRRVEGDPEATRIDLPNRAT
ncbi:MAG: hypothetical protein KJ600_06470 [Nanoarchaeota archaeon]|nr:hypothetical protein [Nanoarchaeota archaeon]MBU1104169.1 hypothetical protein [Nanoarchaeota archaeon]